MAELYLKKGTRSLRDCGRPLPPKESGQPPIKELRFTMRKTHIALLSPSSTRSSVSIRRARRLLNPDQRATLAAETGDGEFVPVKSAAWQLAILLNVSASAIGKARKAKRPAAAAPTTQAAE
jgi:hypothetical protein